MLYSKLIDSKHFPIYNRINLESLNHYKMNQILPPFFIHYLTSYTYMKEWCAYKYPNVQGKFSVDTFNDNCATAAIQSHGEELE